MKHHPNSKVEMLRVFVVGDVVLHAIAPSDVNKVVMSTVFIFPTTWLAACVVEKVSNGNE